MFQVLRPGSIFQWNMAATLEQLLANRNSWSQVIKLELFRGQKDIFRQHSLPPPEASSKADFMVTPGAVTPVPLYEFELRQLLEEATVKSGCKWWCRQSRPSVASQRVMSSLWNISFECRHSGNHYDKQEKDNTRASRCLVRCSCTANCKMKAVSVRMHACALACISYWLGRFEQQRLQTFGCLFFIKSC